MTTPPRWTAEQRRVLADNAHLSHTDILPLLAEAGPARSYRSVRCKRLDLETAHMGRKPRGWAVLPGTPEQRDAAFVRRAIAEGVRLGIVIVAPAP